MPSINLLPLELRKDLPREWRKLLPKIAIVGTTMVVLIVYLIFLGFGFALDKQNAKLEKQLVMLEASVKQAEETQKIIASLEKQEKEFENILQNRTEWNKVLWGINDILPQDMWLTSLAINAEGKLVLKGKSLQLTSIGVLVYELNRMPHFTETKLVKAESAPEGEVAVIDFEIAVGLRKGRGI